MSWREDYAKKRMSMDELMGLIHDGDRIVIQSGDAASYPIMQAMYDRREQMHGVTVYSVLLTKESPISRPECNGHINQVSPFLSAGERNAIADGSRIGVMLVQLNDLMRAWREIIHPNAAIIQVSPPDENGCVSLGTNATGIPEFIDTYERVIAQVNKNVPYIRGEYSTIHVSKLSGYVELDTEMVKEANRPPSEKDLKIAGYIVDMIKDGSCIQLGAGGVPTAVGTFLKDKRHLGIHTEMLAESMMDLIECGAVDNSMKKLLPGKSIFVFSGLTDKHRKMFSEHPELLETRSFEWVNDPYVIAQNDRAVSINSALTCDLTGQVCSESIGPRQYSGVGGQLNFVRGAQLSREGQSYITMYSTYFNKSEQREMSKISVMLPLGSAVTTPRQDVQYIVTEYGVADLRYQTIENRAKRLIAIAHPDFREELTYEAKKIGWIY